MELDRWSNYLQKILKDGDKISIYKWYICITKHQVNEQIPAEIMYLIESYKINLQD